MVEPPKVSILFNRKIEEDQPDFSYANIGMPLVRRTFPQLFANQLVGVQPLSAPVGLAYAARHIYNSAPSTAGWTPVNHNTAPSAPSPRTVKVQQKPKQKCSFKQPTYSSNPGKNERGKFSCNKKFRK